jgi:hypothetical protein
MPCKNIKQLFSDIKDCCKHMATSVPRFVFVLIILYILTPQVCLAETPDNPHHFQMACSSCHLPSNNNETIGKLWIEVNQACGIPACHDVSSPVSHPIGVIADERSSTELPLSDMGQITCITCHDELYNYHDNYLRQTSSGDICASCHYGKGNSTMERAHWQFTYEAHLGNKNSGIFEETETAGGLDIESYTCLSCHDDMTVVIPGENESAYEKVQRWNKMKNHAIGMDYSRKALRKSYYFNNPLTLDESIRLFNGRVGCGSCHNLYSKNKNGLAIPTNSRGGNGQLCRQCHIR